jgi:hypothetical protein
MLDQPAFARDCVPGVPQCVSWILWILGCRTRDARHQPSIEEDRPRALVSLINGYMEEFGEDERQAVDYCRRLPLHSVLSRAGRGEDHHGQRHPHLRRLTREALAEARSRLLAAEERLSRCQSFHELWEVVGDLTCDVYGYGDMAHYDTAVAIGAHLGRV